MKKLLSLFNILLISMFSGVIIGQVFDISPVIPGVISFIGSFIPLPAGSLYGLIYTAPGGIAAPFTQNLPSLPEMLFWDDAGAPLTSLRISTKEEGVIHDWNAAAIAVMNGFLKVGVQPANQVCMLICSGALDRQVTLSGVTSAAGAINFYGNSDNKGRGMTPVPYKTQIETNIALNPTVYQNFTALFIPAMAVLTDYADIEYVDGHMERMETPDLIARSTDYQQIAAQIINNINFEIHRVTLRTAANTPVYILRYFIKGQ